MKDIFLFAVYSEGRLGKLDRAMSSSGGVLYVAGVHGGCLHMYIVRPFVGTSYMEIIALKYRAWQDAYWRLLLGRTAAKHQSMFLRYHSFQRTDCINRFGEYVPSKQAYT